MACIVSSSATALATKQASLNSIRKVAIDNRIALDILLS